MLSNRHAFIIAVGLDGLLECVAGLECRPVDSKLSEQVDFFGILKIYGVAEFGEASESIGKLCYILSKLYDMYHLLKKIISKKNRRFSWLKDRLSASLAPRNSVVNDFREVAPKC